MTPEVEIRAARASDLDAIHRLEQASFPVPWRREFFASELEQSGRLCLVATRGGVVIGYAFAMTVVDEMHINKIAVVETERRMGIAHSLMNICIDAARRRGVAVLSLEVRQSNIGAQEFYRHLNFEPSYVRRRYYPDGETAVVMTRKI
ncbi:MAG TPA: ribosomal protein S18-alanine N-acetyltransferase [Thermoanaerobaculia bacterium]|nr:ribosomal protein S18-alanine N-acetyltransferase [Thermoanaerobaculia bacterium]